LAARPDKVKPGGITTPTRSLLRMYVSVIGILGIGILVLLSDRPGQPATSPLAQTKSVPAAVLPRVFYSRFNVPTLTLADGRTKPILSMLNITRKMKFGEYVWNDKGIKDGDTWIMVDLSGQTMSVFRGRHEIGSAPVLYGADNKPTPLGVFPVLQKAQAHRSNLYDAEMPYMLRLSWDGVAIHASDVQNGQATHGCIGVPPAFARLIFDHIRVGDLVSVTKA